MRMFYVGLRAASLYLGVRTAAGLGDFWCRALSSLSETMGRPGELVIVFWSRLCYPDVISKCVVSSFSLDICEIVCCIDEPTCFEWIELSVVCWVARTGMLLALGITETKMESYPAAI